MIKSIPAAAATLAVAAVAALPGAAAGRRHHGHRHPTRAVHAYGEQGTSPSPSWPASLQAGTVTSFQAGTLIVTLNDGQVLTGKVAAPTRIVCGTPPPVPPPPHTPPEPPAGGGSDHQAQVRADVTPGPGDAPGSGDPVPPAGGPSEPHPPAPPAPGAGEGPSGPESPTGPGSAGKAGDGQSGRPGDAPGKPYVHPCGTDALTPGTAVHELGLIAAPQGERFNAIALIK